VILAGVVLITLAKARANTSASTQGGR
jgi:hypothetical protein